MGSKKNKKTELSEKQKRQAEQLIRINLDIRRKIDAGGGIEELIADKKALKNDLNGR